MKGLRVLSMIVIVTLLFSCAGKGLSQFARTGFVIQVVEATEDDLSLIKNAWDVRDLVETRAYSMEREISYEFQIKDGKDLRNIAKIHDLFAGIKEQNGKKPFSFAPFQDKHLVKFIAEKKGIISLRLFVGDKLKHYEAYDLVKDDLNYTIHSLLVK